MKALAGNFTIYEYYAHLKLCYDDVLLVQYSKFEKFKKHGWIREKLCKQSVK